MKNGKISLTDAKSNQIIFKSHLFEMKKGSKKSKEQKKHNIQYWNTL